jgi:hypothetical protein
MNHLSGIGALLVAGVIALPAGAGLAIEQRPLPEGPQTQQLLVRRGGGGGRSGGRSGGSRGGRGSGRSGGGRSRARSGFSGSSGHLNRGSRRPSSGWSRKVSSPSARPSINRAGGRRDLGRGGSVGRGRPGSRDLNRNLDRNRGLARDRGRSFDRNVNRNRTVNRNIDRNVRRDINRRVDRNVNWNRRVNINNVNVRPGWARAGWGVARPWNHGWYGGWSTPSWGWWGARAAAWGIGTLATASIINNAVDRAVQSNTQYIVVPNTSYQLLYGSVQPTGSSSVSFAVTADDSTYQLTADCTNGLIDGRAPDSAEEAELLNAACQVAFGSA